jgi:hypothetical protein
MGSSALGVGVLRLTIGTATAGFADGNDATTIDVPVSFVAVNLCHFDIEPLGERPPRLPDSVQQRHGAHFFVLHDTLHVGGTDAAGARYVGNGGDVGNFNIAAGSTFSLLRHFTLISQGSDPNLTFSEHEHVTVDANSNVKVTFDNGDLECTA